MNIKSCEKKEKNTAELVVEISAEEFGAAMGNAFKKNRARISVPGFRKGKAPRGIIERIYGASIFHSDALEILMPDVLRFVMEEADLKLAGMPDVTDVDIKEDGSGADIIMDVSLMPEVSIGQYKGLFAAKPEADVPESDIDKEVEAVRLRNARIDKAQRPLAGGDIAIIDYEGFIDGEPFDGGTDTNYELEIDSGTFIPGFEEKLKGMSAGEEREIDLTFPENYSDKLSGKPVVFKVKLNEVKEKLLPELDDEFAKDVSEFDTLEEYRANIKGRLLAEKNEDNEAAFENELMDKIIGTIEADIPDVLIEKQMDDSMQGLERRLTSYNMDPASYFRMMNTTREVYRESTRMNCTKQVKGMLALTKIAELEGIEVSAEDIESEYAEVSERFGMDVDKLKKNISEDRIVSDIKMRRAMKIVTDSATVDNTLPKDDGQDAGAAAPAKASKKADGAPASKKKGKAASADAANADASNANDAADAANVDAADAADAADASQSAAGKKPAARKAAKKKPEGE